MGMKLYSLAVAMFIFIAMAIIPAIAESSSNEKIPVIVGFKDKSDAALVKAHGGDIKYHYDNIPAIAVSLPEQAINALKNNPNVEYIEEDTEVHILGETLPWGVDRVEADVVAANTDFTGDGIKVAVLDTGIDYTHPDLAANYVDGYNVINPRKTPMDDNGHGTHVAGTIAAVHNDIGVVGVAPEAELYAVKVLNRAGSGWVSDINAGIDWAITNDMDVISMSLGGSYDSESQEDVCQRAYDAGIVIVAAAGNDDFGPVNYPAAYSSVIAVSATKSNDGLASFSNIGPQIELAAPGVYINSTTLGGGYSDDWSGTSMATPHVSGVVALLLSSDESGASQGNGDGLWDPAEVRERLHYTADDYMITSGNSNYYYGYGIVDASAALAGLQLSGGPTDPTGDNLVVSDPIVVDHDKLDGKFVWATATVTVTDGETGLAVEGVKVEGVWTVENDGVSSTYTDSGITDSSGTVVFKSKTLRYPVAPSFSFEVTSAT